MFSKVKACKAVKRAVIKEGKILAYMRIGTSEESEKKPIVIENPDDLVKIGFEKEELDHVYTETLKLLKEA